MTKKATCVLAVIVLALAMCIGFTACNKTATYDKTIVFLGDSIAEALIGPSPLSERDNYGYYALVGRMNNFKYYNHSVSGHKTSGGMAGSDGLLEMVNRDDENAALMKTHIQQADIIHISVLGNNILQYNLGLLMLEVADPEFEAKYAEGTTLLNAMHDGNDATIYRDSVEDENAVVGFKFPSTYNDICNIIARLKELNPDATIIFQKVYNPFYENSSHLHDAVKVALAKITDDGRFGMPGQPITTVEQYRAVAQVLLDNLNGILDEYIENHHVEGKPDDIVILDINKEFERITQMDKNDDDTVNLSEDCLGRKLIYADWTHPSNFGHAVIACATQNLLEELGFAKEGAIQAYRMIRVDQLNRLYNNVIPNKDAVVKQIMTANDFDAINFAYFGAIDGYTPVNY